MPWRGAFPVLWRAAVATVALYALLLQPFVAAATPAIPGPHDGICAPAGDPSGAPHGPAGHAHPCCLPAPGDVAALPPSDPGAAVAWPVPIAGPVRHVRPEAARLATGPPVHAQSPRGPPSA